MSEPTTPHWPCECMKWCRADIAFANGKPLPMTNHHPRCEHVNESLMEVWRVTIPGETGGCVCESEALARQMAGDDEDAPMTVAREKMHREIYETLNEFNGF